MSFFRSEPMSLCQIVLHTESAFNCLIMLGYEGKVQFRNIYDGNTSVNNQFNIEIERCQELTRLINHLEENVNKCNINTIIYPDVDGDEIPEANDLKSIEPIVQQIYNDFVRETTNVEILNKKRILLSEQLQVLQRADEFFGVKAQNVKAAMAWSDSVIKMLMKNELNAEEGDGMYLSFFTGTIPAERFHAFEIMLWRLTKGYFYMKYYEYFPIDGKNLNEIALNEKRKLIFIIFFFGQELRKKIEKLCQGFGIKLFECAESYRERQIEEEVLRKEIVDLDIVIEYTQEHCLNLLLIAAADLYIWRVNVNKMMMVYYVLNRMNRVRDLNMHKYLQAECWIPTRDIPTVRSALLFGARRTAKGNMNSMFMPMLHETSECHLKDLDKPTYFVLDKFTKGFQKLIDSYDVAQYRELNPTPYTIITFPFLFAVMFGDIGHGFILFLFGIWMVWKEESLQEKKRFARQQSEIFNIFFAGRYIISLMGAFSIYTGLIYNDCFSKSFNIFGSSWRTNFNRTTVAGSHELQLDPSNREYYLGTPYILGMDPMWKASGENAITTFNSFKMKLAIIFGVSQMVFGIILSAFNFIYKREYVNMLLVFLPQLTFFVCIFVYLVFLIFYKWIQFGGQIAKPYNSACAPSILITFINMIVFKVPKEAAPGCETWMFDTQPYIQLVLMTLALISIPVLLAGKPLYCTIQQRKIQKIKDEQERIFQRHKTGSFIKRSLVYNVESSSHVFESQFPKRDMQHSQTDLTELWIHSGIHCVESVLSSVSHTASYLRLWALSLAHEQLSTVLWNLVLKVGLTGKRGYWNSLVLCVVFIFWAMLTVAILVVMEGLSAFLHTLRLHWVEFQSKFYNGSGGPFQPFYFTESSPNDAH